MQIEKLKKLGFNENEAKVYLSLLELSESQAGEISKKTQINRTTIYDSLERLIEKGFVTYVISANKKVFRPASPKKILELIEEKQKIASDLIPELENIFSVLNRKEEANIYHGKKGIKTILNEILKFKEYFALGSSGEFLKFMKNDFINFQLKKKELKIKSKILQSDLARKNIELKNFSYAKFKYLSDEYFSPNTIIIYGDSLAIIVWGENPIAIIVKSEQVVDSFKKYFELLWNLAKV